MRAARETLPRFVEVEAVRTDAARGVRGVELVVEELITDRLRAGAAETAAGCRRALAAVGDHFEAELAGVRRGIVRLSVGAPIAGLRI